MDANVPKHTTIIQSERPVETITFDDGRWFRLLNWLVDSGLWARLSEGGIRVFPVMARHLDGRNFCTADDDVLMTLAGVRRRTLFEARRQLVAFGLIRKARGGVWEVFPDRPFKGRASAAGGTPGAASGTLFPEGSAASGTASAASGTPSKNVREDDDVGDGLPTPPPGRRPEEFAAAVALLVEQGIEEDEAPEFAAKASLRTLRGYVEMADRKAKTPEGLTSRKGYIIAAILRAYPLFPDVAKAVTGKATEAAARRIAPLLEARLSPERMREFRRALAVGGHGVEGWPVHELAYRALRWARVEDPDLFGDDALLDLAMAAAGKGGKR